MTDSLKFPVPEAAPLNNTPPMPAVMWSGMLLDPSGYGEASRRYVLGLDDRKEFKLKVKVNYGFSGVLPSIGDKLKRIQALDRTPLESDEPFIFIQHGTPDTWQIGPKNCKYHIGVTTFETDSVPKQWQPPLRMMDELFVFSRFNKEVFESTGIQRPITIIPHGVDTNVFRPGLEPLPEIAKHGKGLTVFGSNFDWSPRKNPEGLIRAYFKAFKRTDPVLLVLKTYKYPLTPDKGREFVRAQIEAIRKQVGMTQSSCPRIAIITEMLTEGELARFYNSLTCYVSPACGEGWGLTMSEAMACGLPTIGVNWSGNTDFMNDDNSILIKGYKLVEITPEMAGDRQLYIGHRWARCDEDELGMRFTEVVNFPEKAKATGEVARFTMDSFFSWSRACMLISDRLHEIVSPF